MTPAPTLPATWTIELPYPAPPLSLNRRMHYQAEHRVRRQILDDVQMLARAGKLPKGLDRVHIELHWQPSVRRRRDTDNPTPTLKACIDGLTTGYGLTVDDDSEHVTSGVTIVFPLAKRPRVWLTIHHMSGGRS